MDTGKLQDLLKSRNLSVEKVEYGAAIAVHLTDRTNKDEILGVQSEIVEISLTVPPTDEKANKALVKFLAKQLRVKPSTIEIVAGQSGYQKLVSIIGLSPQEVTRRLSL